MGDLSMGFLVNPYIHGAGGSAPAFPSIGSTWEYWEPARETTYNNDDQITTLNGQENNRDWAKGGAGSAPLYKTNVLNGLAVADTDGAARHWFTGPDMSALTAVHCFMVVLAINDPATDVGQTGLADMGSAATSAGHYPYTDSNIYEPSFSSARKTLGNPAAALTSWRVYELISVSGEYTAKIDGTQIFTTGTNTV